MKKENFVIFTIAVLLLTSFASADLATFGRTVGDEIGSAADEVYSVFTGNTNPFIFFEPSPETPKNNTLIGEGRFETDTTIDESSLEKLKYNFNGTNYTIYNDSLVGMWNFDDFTKFNDTSWYENDGTCSGSSCPTFTSDGKHNGAYDFDGSDDYIYAPDSESLDIEDEITISAWVKYDSVDTWDQIVVKREAGNGQRSYALNRDANNNGYNFALANSTSHYSVSSNTQISLGKWQHVTGIREGDKIKIYVNGNFESQKDFKGSIVTNNANLSIGQQLDGSYPIDGSIDEVRIWNRSLSEDEVNQMYMSNLRKFNETRWKLYVNQTKNSTDELKTNTYKYRASAQGSAGYTNSTEKRTINIDLTPPFIEFVSPTPANDTTKKQDKSATINISSNDIENSLENDSLEHSTFLDWNNSLVGWWEMDFSNSTGIHDNSTYNNFGTFNGGLSQANKTDGKRGKGLEFDGVDDKLTTPQIKLNENEWAVTSWYYPKSFNDYGHIFTSENSQSEFATKVCTTACSTNFVPYFYSGSTGSLRANTGLNQNEWHHLGYVYNGTHINLYLNGNLDASHQTSISSIPKRSFGVQAGSTGEYVNAIHDSLQVYNRSLGPSEIKALYNASADQYIRSFNDLNRDTYKYTGYSIDKFANINSTEERTLKIKNVPPSINASFPSNNHITTNRTPTFNWTASDPEGDTLTYELDINCHPGCSSDDRLISGISNKEYTITNYLKYLSDNGFYYNWSVRAYDGTNYSNWTEERRLDVNSLIQTRLTKNSTNFGNMANGDEKNTTDGNPNPLRIENTGNAFVNSSINSTPMWQSISHPNSNYQYMITENESNSYDPSGTQTNWADTPGMTTHAIEDLNWTSQRDSANIDLYVKVPSQESAGSKNSTITITSSLSELE